MTDPGATPDPADVATPGETVRAVASPRFKLVWLSILAVTVLALIAEVVLSLAGSDDSRNVRRVIGTCDWVVKSGAGALFGMVAGKATQ